MLNRSSLLLLLAVVAVLALAPFGLVVAIPENDPGGGTDWIGQVIGVVILAGILYFAYTRIKKSKEKKAARAAAAPSTTQRPPSG